MIRIIRLKNALVLKITTVMVVIFCLVYWYRYQENQTNQIQGQQTVTQSVLIYPDNIKYSDDSFYGIGTITDTGKQIMVYGSDAKRVKRYSKPIIMNVSGVVQPFDEARNFNQFDAKEYYESMSVYSRLTVKQLNSVEEQHRFSIIDSLHYLRMLMLKYTNQLPHPLNLYASSLFLGVMDNSFNDELSGVKTLGLIHLFSISGLHVFYIVNLLKMILGLFCVTREKTRWATLIFLPTYFVIAGSSIGLMRSILTVEIGIIALMLKKRLTSLDVFSITLMANLLIDPEMLLQFGSQLSYALAFGLIYTNKMRPLKQTVMMNLVSLPFIIYKLFQWHALTMLANYLVIPIFSALIMPMILIAVITYPIAGWFSSVVAFILNSFDAAVNWLGALPGQINFGKPNLYVATLLLIMTLVVIDKVSFKRVSLLLCMYLITFMYIHYPLQGEVSFFDVGQGDSILIREPFNHSITMIDTGGKLQFGRRQNSKVTYQAEKTSINYLKSIGINHLDNLVLSHQDADHTGDVFAILADLKVDRIIVGDGLQNNPSIMRKISPYLNKTKLVLIKANQKLPDFPFNIYHPFESGLGKNEDSVVLGTIQGNRSWLFMGDLPSSGENDIMQKYPMLKADYLKLGHHGSDTSSSDAFLKFIHPKVSIISAGRNNRYHHPSVATLERLKDNNLAYVNTQKLGMISYKYGLLGNYWIFKLQGE
ncbi:DNA internalization-related competence protein ComEC/Rec2 [Apilactobacillus kunkeei]|uniref:DNA internalization-related competence protein ComEC/Rec2 n=1 Tax=Apilactobacillus kunkeei TaxID=148814 RepID=UPI001C6F92E2|nr:DNA internalization-related competence protein ComEC/Rec2 [Apilactobacillus kunkeei]MBX8455748.1 DNA internalization-related competence protein ComEC/Rec2 [Apilactobacillus kunkeei]QYU53945.1 DNA internalization-related competence protein ComEC/Rec2 [Apilactobacillus kunkeei]